MQGSVAPTLKAFNEVWPEAQLQNIVDDSLSVDVAQTGLDEKMDSRFRSLATYARACDVQGVLFTCSAFGSSIEKVKEAEADIPVLKPNEAMMEEAVRLGGKVGVLSVFAPTLPSIERELMDIAVSLEQAEGLELQVQFVPDALAVLHVGDEARYNDMIADAAQAMHEATPGGLDVCVLAMFSMACASEAVAGRIGPTVRTLTSPNSAVAKLKRMLA